MFVKKGTGQILVNGIDYRQYFPLVYLQHQVVMPLQVTDQAGAAYDFIVTVKGGGKTGQAEAVRLGVSRMLCELADQLRPLLKAASLLTRDPRSVERKKSGRKKARKKFQFVKR